MTHLNFASRQTVIDAIKIGKPVLVLDDSDRENEADLIIAAEKITVPIMAELIRYGSGIVCLALSDTYAEKLALPMMTPNNTSRQQTQFTISIDARSLQTTGISASDRVQTVQAVIADDATAADLARPGHVFPVVAHPQGLKARRGHTEAAIALTTLAGLKPVCVICELMQDDGRVANREEAATFARDHQYPIVEIDAIAQYNVGRQSTHA